MLSSFSDTQVEITPFAPRAFIFAVVSLDFGVGGLDDETLIAVTAHFLFTGAISD